MHMDVEYARLARTLPLPKGAVSAPKANVIENATASYKSPNAGASGGGVSVLFIDFLLKIIKIESNFSLIFSYLHLLTFRRVQHLLTTTSKKVACVNQSKVGAYMHFECVYKTTT